MYVWAGFPSVCWPHVRMLPTASYVYGLVRVAQVRSGTTSLYVDDATSTRALRSPGAPATSDRYDYDAFGTLLRATGTTPNSHLFRGEEFDPSVGLYYLRARYYRPDTGRFLTADAWRGDIRSPQTLHRYAYPSNNPSPAG